MFFFCKFLFLNSFTHECEARIFFYFDDSKWRICLILIRDFMGAIISESYGGWFGKVMEPLGQGMVVSGNKNILL